MRTKFALALLCAAALSVLTFQVKGEEQPIEPKFDPDHRAEAEQLLNSMRDASRVTYSKTGVAPTRLTGDDGCKLEADNFKGEYFTVTDKVYKVGESGTKGALTAEPVEARDGYAILVFVYASGKSEISWHATFEELKKANEEVVFDDAVAEEPAEPEPDAQAQWDALYKVGANWTMKGAGGMLIKTEVAEVKDGIATIKTSVNFGGNWMAPSESEAKRPEKTTVVPLADPNWKETGTGTDKFKVGDRELDVSWVEGTYSGKAVRNTISIKYGLAVKAEYDGKVSLELTEFNPKE